MKIIIDYGLEIVHSNFRQECFLGVEQMTNYHHTYFGNLSLTHSFENYKLALEKHNMEREVAKQNYGGMNFTHSTSAKVKEYKQALLFAFK